MGENGAGKSTLIKIMAGVYGKDAGTIRIQGREVDIKSPRDSLKQGIKVVFQEIALISEFTVAENIFLEGYPTGKGGSIDWKKITRRFRRPVQAHRLQCRSRRAHRVAAGQPAADGGDRAGAGA